MVRLNVRCRGDGWVAVDIVTRSLSGASFSQLFSWLLLTHRYGITRRADRTSLDRTTISESATCSRTRNEAVNNGLLYGR